MCFEGLFDLLEVLEQAQVGCKLTGRLCDTGQRSEYLSVNLTGVGLTGNRNNTSKAEVVSDHLLHLLDLLIIAVEQFHKGSLRTGGALRAQHAQILDTIVDLVEVHEQLVHPKSCTLADGSQLCGLEMGETKGGLRLVLFCEDRQLFQNSNQLFTYQLEAFTQLNDVGVIAYISAGRSQMNNAGSLGGNLAESIDMTHNVMTDFLLTCTGDLVVDVVLVGLHLIDLLLGDVETQSLLCLSQRDPQTTPGGELHVGRKDIQHLLGSITCRERTFINSAQC